MKICSEHSAKNNKLRNLQVTKHQNFDCGRSSQCYNSKEFGRGGAEITFLKWNTRPVLYYKQPSGVATHTFKAQIKYRYFEKYYRVQKYKFSGNPKL